MKSIFVKATHFSTAPCAIFLDVFFLVLAIVYHLDNRPGSIQFIVITLFLGILLFAFSFLADKVGIYISDKEIYYKRFKKVPIKCADIAGIKIIMSQAYGEMDYNLKTISGEQLYSAVFVRRVDEKMYIHKSEKQFHHEFKKDILFFFNI